MTPPLQRAAAAMLVALVGALWFLFAPALAWLGLPVAWGGLFFSLVFALAGDAPRGALFGVAFQRARTLVAQLPLWAYPAALWLLLKIPVPLFPELFPILATVSTFALAVAASLYAWQRVGKLSLWLAAVALGVGFGVEYLGSHTGFPFGPYSYAGAPEPTLAGVPLLVPLGWWGMTLSAAVLARGRPLLAAALLVAWDIGLEPLMTTEGFWSWQDPWPLWAGAGAANFAGWFAVGAFLCWAFGAMSKGQLWNTPAAQPRLQISFAAPYLLESMFLPLGLMMLGMPVAGLVTAAAMGLGLLASQRASGLQAKAWGRSFFGGVSREAPQ